KALAGSVAPGRSVCAPGQMPVLLCRRPPPERRQIMWFSARSARRHSSASRDRRSTPKARLRVESLEDRLVLSGGNAATDPSDWPMYNYNPEGTRDNVAEHILSPATVGGLQVKWTFPTHGPIAGTPAVVNDHVYVADADGFVYALDRNGHELWETQLQVG